MRVVIAGAGIAGLSAAIALRGEHEVVLLEQAEELEAAGAGLTLFANAVHALGRLAVADQVKACASAARGSALLTWDGRELFSMPSALLAGAVAVHRADLQRVLAAAQAGDLRLGEQVVGVDEINGRVAARTANGGVETADLLIGADGLNSAVRRAVVDAQPRYAGYTAWRGVANAAGEPGRLTESWGIGERFGLVDLGQGSTYWFATKNAPAGEAETPATRKRELLDRFAGWHPPIAGMIEATPETAILRNDVYYLEPFSGWSRGRIVLLGDAAHATTPGIGQGAALAIEDAVVLAQTLAGGDQVEAALRRYESARRARCVEVLKRSREIDRAAQLANPFACRVRNALVARIPASLQRRRFGPIVDYRV